MYSFSFSFQLKRLQVDLNKFSIVLFVNFILFVFFERERRVMQIFCCQVYVKTETEFE